MIVLKPEAAVDLAAASGWYEGKRPGLGGEFLLEADRAFERIDNRPAGYARIHGELRRAIVRRFPYGVFFLTDGLGLVTIYAVLHHRRSPAEWQRRYVG